MITETGRLKLEYEYTRLLRYNDVRKTIYSQKDLSAAYWDWAHTPSHKREPEWDAYCDVRDQVPMGTNAKIRKQRLAARYN